MRSGRQRTGRSIGALTTALGIRLLVPGVAGAAFTGFDGSVAFVAASSRSVAIRQVDPVAADGTRRGYGATTTTLAAGPGAAGPAYSPDGTLLAFASNRSGSAWSIYAIGPTRGGGTSVSMVSQVAGSAVHDDYAPSFTDDGRVMVFDRDNARIETTVLASGPASTCTLDVPSSGLAPASPRDASGSRIVVDPSTLVFAGGDGHLHLLSGVVPPTAARPCPVRSHLTDTDLSAEATGATVAPYADARPDWSPDGSRIVFDSSRRTVPHGPSAGAGGRPGGRTLWFLDDPTATSPTVVPVWPGSTPTGRHPQPVPARPTARAARREHTGGTAAAALAGRLSGDVRKRGRTGTSPPAQGRLSENLPDP